MEDYRWLLPLGRMSAGETRALRLYRGLYTYEIQLGLYIWTPALYLFSQIHRVRAPDAPPRLAAEGMEELDRVYSTDSLEQF